MRSHPDVSGFSLTSNLFQLIFWLVQAYEHQGVTLELSPELSGWLINQLGIPHIAILSKPFYCCKLWTFEPQVCFSFLKYLLVILKYFKMAGPTRYQGKWFIPCTAFKNALWDLWVSIAFCKLFYPWNYQTLSCSCLEWTSHWFLDAPNITYHTLCMVHKESHKR